MNLIIDIGNTALKMAVFESNSLLKKEFFPLEDFLKKIPVFFKQYPTITKTIVSNVSKIPNDALQSIQQYTEVLMLDASVKMPFENNYETPETLGRDRLALIAAAVKDFPGKNVLVIDVGTCVTYDLKTDKEIYLGGAISPGLGIRFQSLHKFTANLPLVNTENLTSYLGTSTNSSIRAGVMYGLEMEIQGVIKTYQTDFEDLTIILTGGDNQFLSIPLKNSIFANSNFLLEGLNFILEFNKTQ